MPPLLIAHSMGCLVVAHWAHRSSAPVRAAFLVAVPDPEGPPFPLPHKGFTRFLREAPLSKPPGRQQRRSLRVTLPMRNDAQPSGGAYSSTSVPPAISMPTAVWVIGPPVWALFERLTEGVAALRGDEAFSILLEQEALVSELSKRPCLQIPVDR